MVNEISGWWFQNFLFSIIYGIIHPIDWDGLLLGLYIYTGWWFGT